MPEKRFSDVLKEFLLTCQGKEIDLNYIRQELRIEPGTPAWNGLRQQMARAVEDGLAKPSGRKDGIYKVITQVQPVKVFGRERQPLIQLAFPKDFETGEELCFAHDIILRGGDLILISGQSNYGKTTLCMNFCAENIDDNPVLMGNEYTTIDNEPSPRFLDRIDKMNTVTWFDSEGNDRFTLLPVREDFAEHVVKNRLNIADWINLEEHYLISPVMESFKRALGKTGIGVVVIQKSAGSATGRGGQFTKDFADVEILLDPYGETGEVLMTLGKVKESRQKVTGRYFAYSIENGVHIVNFRELSKCLVCFGKGWKGVTPCNTCHKRGFIEK